MHRVSQYNQATEFAYPLRESRLEKCARLKPLLTESVRFLYDSGLLALRQQPLAQRARIWRSFAKLFVGAVRGRNSAKVVGFNVSYFDRATLKLLYREIFVRQNYRFDSETPAPVIYDCGANLGMATLFFKFAYPNSRIKCFEPDPKTFALLQKNISDNQLQSVEPFNVALWNEDGAVDFFVDSADPGSLLMSTSPSRMHSQAIQVPARRLSEFIDGEIEFLKLDVEGAELRVLQELSEAGKISMIRQMAIEYHHRIPGERSAMSSCLGILEESGFEYQIAAGTFPDPSVPRYQDVMIYARRA
jgi:FkbM family methyltransferase